MGRFNLFRALAWFGAIAFCIIVWALIVPVLSWGALLTLVVLIVAGGAIAGVINNHRDERRFEREVRFEADRMARIDRIISGARR